MNILDDIKDSAMSRFQIITIAVCLAVMVVDGFDVIAMSFSAHYVADEWGISPSTLGYALSASTAGMAMGSLILAPIADRYGRRIVALGSLAVAATGMLYSGVAGSFEHLLASRVITGVGIGGVMATMGVIIAEYSSRRRLGLTMALFATANGAGGVLGGLLAGDLIPAHGWRAVFLFGAAATAVVLAVAVAVVPESLDYLVTRRDDKSVRRLHRLASRMGRPLSEIGEAAVSDEPPPVQGRYSDLFTRGTARSTVLLTIGFAALMAGFYFILGWTPQLITQATGSAETGINVGLLLPLGGIVGCVGFGLLTGITRIRPLTVVVLALAAVATAVMAYSIATGSAPYVVALALGIMFNAGVSGYYGVIPQAFPARVRTTGFGFVLGVARIVGILSPIAAGYLLGMLSSATVYALVGVLVGISAVVFAVHARSRVTGQPTDLPPDRELVVRDTESASSETKGMTTR